MKRLPIAKPGALFYAAPSNKEINSFSTSASLFWWDLMGMAYAIQDAVVTANVLGGKLVYGIVQLDDLATVQRLREWPTRLIQAYQGLLQKNVFASVFNSDQPFTVPLRTKLLLRIPFIRDIPGRIMALGFRPVHLREP